ncbi:MAG TPA: hypothetical protein DCR93_37385 [Cytophagales bacterium]|nr:hypothetical protein [Cytophagales bacterium]
MRSSWASAVEIFLSAFGALAFGPVLEVVAPSAVLSLVDVEEGGVANELCSPVPASAEWLLADAGAGGVKGEGSRLPSGVSADPAQKVVSWALAVALFPKTSSFPFF